MSNRYVNTSPMAREQRPYAAHAVHVMETLGHPVSPDFQYQVGMYVYVHEHAFETNPGSARECVIEDVTNAPLEIVVRECNHETPFTVSQDKLSSPIVV